MARKRTVNPTFNDDDDIIALSPWARLLYILLWCQMDKQCLIEDSPRSIRSKVFPREEHSTAEIQKWLDELLARGPSGRPRLVRVEWNGKVLLYCPTLPRHNRIYSDEPVFFNVPESELKRAKDAAYAKPSAASTENPRGPDVGQAGEPPNSSVPSSSSSSTCTSPSPSVEPTGDHVGDNSPTGVENAAIAEELLREAKKRGAGPGVMSRIASACGLKQIPQAQSAT